ncbi:negative elongation factor D-like [Asterias amurensis]|uniref:negative elongation factor D-like n=1 Tax=Asterias amurensis TaxID=7602 RepID=UPI003AB7981E
MDPDDYGDWDYDHPDVDQDDAEEEEPEEVPDPYKEDETKDDEVIQRECLKAFASTDYIMESGVFKDLKRYFQSGGTPEQVVLLLSENYTAVAQTVNLFAEWLIFTGVNPTEVQQRVEDHLKAILIKHFDPKKADSIFSEEGGTPAWLEIMIQHRTWRSLFYKLAEAHPDCLMLNFTIKLISDAGYQGEIGNVSTACHEIEVFTKVLQTTINKLLEGGEDAVIKHLPEFSKMVCHGEHTYLYAQMLMHLLAKDKDGGSIIRRLYQEVQNAGKNKGEGVTQISLALSSAAAYPKACQALLSMISREALNTADITVLYKFYSAPDPPPVELIRIPQLLDLFLRTLFKPGAVVNSEHRHKYTYLLAYSASVHEIYKKEKRSSLNKDELKSTSTAIEKAHSICSNDQKVGSELTAELTAFYQCVRYPVVALGVLYWVDKTVTDPAYFQRITDHTPLHLIVLDEVVNCHPLIHGKVLDLLKRLFEDPYPQLDVLVQMELKKTILDRMVHLLSKGFVVPVVQYIAKCVDQLDTDMSLIRHFVTEVLDMIAPPYTSEFVHLFSPIIENQDITGTLRNEEGKDPVSNFIVHCKTNFIMMT